jgi:hypothetical protein
MNNVHDNEPTVFETRWAMSYLRGPLTRNQIKLLMDPVKKKADSPPVTSTPTISNVDIEPQPETTLVNTHRTGSQGMRPILPPGVPQCFAPVRSSQPGQYDLFYQPGLICGGELHFNDAKTGVNLIKYVLYRVPVAEGPVSIEWDTATEIFIKTKDLEQSPQEPALYGDLPVIATKPDSYTAWNRDFINWLYRTQNVELWKSPGLKEYSRVNESERDFRVRLLQKAREQRDEATEKLRQKYAPRFTSLQEQARRAQANVEREKEQARQYEVETTLSFGTTILGGFLGKRGGSLSRTRSTMSRANRSRKEAKDVERAQDTVEAIQQRIRQLEADFSADTATLAEKINPLTEQFEKLSVRPAKTDISVQLLTLGWLPYWRSPDGILEQAW